MEKKYTVSFRISYNKIADLDLIPEDVENSIYEHWGFADFGQSISIKRDVSDASREIDIFITKLMSEDESKNETLILDEINDWVNHMNTKPSENFGIGYSKLQFDSDYGIEVEEEIKELVRS